MSFSRYRDLWLVLGLGGITLAGVNLIAWQLREGERLSLREVQIREIESRKRDDEAKARKRAKKCESHTDDDISLSALANLIHHPDYDIRHSAIKVLIHRYAADPYCQKAFEREFSNLTPAKVDDEHCEDPVLRVQLLVGNYGLEMPVSGGNAASVSGDTERLEDWMELIEEGHPGFRARMERLDGREHLGDREGQPSPPPAPVRRPLTQWQRREAVVMDSEDSANPPELVIPREDRSTENGGGGDDTSPETAQG